MIFDKYTSVKAHLLPQGLIDIVNEVLNHKSTIFGPETIKIIFDRISQHTDKINARTGTGEYFISRERTDTANVIRLRFPSFMKHKSYVFNENRYENDQAICQALEKRTQVIRG